MSSENTWALFAYDECINPRRRTQYRLNSTQDYYSLSNFMTKTADLKAGKLGKAGKPGKAGKLIRLVR
jgi:hypothetical protein